MIVSGRNNVKEILKNFKKNNGIKKAILQNNFNELDILSLIKSRNIPLKYMEKAKLDALAKNNHQGVILEIRDFNYVDIDSIIANKDKCTIVILDHLEDPHNLGAIVRTAEASGVDGIILPINRSVSVNETVMKTSVGALSNVKICQVTNLMNTIKSLKKNGFWIYGADMNGEDYSKIDYAKKSCLIIGNEGSGLSHIVRESCDFIVSIPMYGKVNSLNASVAAGILLYGVVLKK
jgi:23S rRNA (guanosine2251-2'-O)-methyltransferase